jgi:predicted nucleic acid-binding protein
MGLTHLDSGVVIGFLDAGDAHHESARVTLEAARDRRDGLAMSASALAECLVGPSRRGPDAVASLLGLFERLPIDVVPLDRDIAICAAGLRARWRSLRLPDALVIASAHTGAADRLVTTDRAWPSADQLAVDVTIDVI